MRPLNQRQKSFVALMAVGTYSATDAWIKAGYSAHTARFQASRALTKPNIQQAIAERKQLLAESANAPEHALTPEVVMARTAELMRSDNPSAAVAATRLAADVLGLLQGGKREMADGAVRLLEALGRGMRLEVQQPGESPVHQLEGSAVREVDQSGAPDE